MRPLLPVLIVALLCILTALHGKHRHVFAREEPTAPASSDTSKRLGGGMQSKPTDTTSAKSASLTSRLPSMMARPSSL